jgi:hypothetical protein
MTETAVADVAVDSTATAAADDAGPTRRRISSTNLGRGERVRKVDVEVGEYVYTVRCPKLVVWSDMASIIAEQAGGSRGDRRRKGDTAPAEGRVTTDRLRLTQAMQHFLRGCMTAADWHDLESDLADPDNEVDIPDLWAAGLKLLVEFRGDMEAMAKTIGMKIPAEIGALAERINADGTIEPEPEPAPAPARPAPRKAANRP